MSAQSTLLALGSRSASLIVSCLAFALVVFSLAGTQRATPTQIVHAGAPSPLNATAVQTAIAAATSAIISAVSASGATVQKEVLSMLERQPGTPHLDLDVNCKLTFVSYQPSSWEADWLAKAPSLAEEPLVDSNGASRICNEFRKNGTNQAAWVNATRQWLLGESGYSEISKIGGSVLSALVLFDECSGNRYRAWIEPLVGHYRHPFSLENCSAHERVSIEAREYLLLSGLPPKIVQRLYPGRRLFFDLGTSRYNTSLRFFTETYQRLGVEFDELWAWELNPQPVPEYWHDVPSNILKKLHFYNLGVVNDTVADDNPFNIIRAVARPGDYVVVKLDIDNDALELSFMGRLADDAELRGLISEMMFEMHYYHPDMAMYFGTPSTKYPSVGELFKKLREKGLRLHYWP